MAEYDRGYRPPQWWLEEFERVHAKLDWNDGDIAARAKEIDGRDKRWDSTRISKMRNTGKSTLDLVLAISAVMEIPPPFFEAESIDEAREFQQFRRRSAASRANPDRAAREAAVAQGLEAAVEEAIDQTRPVVSRDEGSPRDPRTRRAPRSR